MELFVVICSLDENVGKKEIAINSGDIVNKYPEVIMSYDLEHPVVDSENDLIWFGEKRDLSDGLVPNAKFKIDI